ncbi:MAG: SapC family protein [Betaproteobacteria bacterium]|nr:SapC family protein [Betaproteobacteria bacterium]
MTTQLLIYESAVPVTAARHGNWSIEAANDFSFSKHVNSLPLMAVEFPNAASEYAIVFSGTKEAVIPAVILGMRSDENLYLTEDGGWQAKYVPAFARRYPFVFSTSQDGKTFSLCIDESYPRFNQEGRGERLFTDDRKPTPYVERVLKFLEQYQIEFRRTQAFCKKLLELDLLEPMRAQADLGTGEKLSLTGFMAVNRDKMKALPAEKLAEFAKTDELELLYLHLHAMRNFPAMAERLAKGPAGVAEGQASNPRDETPAEKKQAARARK